MTTNSSRSCNVQQKPKIDKHCPKCNQSYGDVTFTKCLICGKKLLVLTENSPECPTCHSINVRKISTTKRAAHGVAFGIFSKTVFSQFECCNCGYKW